MPPIIAAYLNEAQPAHGPSPGTVGIWVETTFPINGNTINGVAEADYPGTGNVNNWNFQLNQDLDVAFRTSVSVGDLITAGDPLATMPAEDLPPGYTRTGILPTDTLFIQHVDVTVTATQINPQLEFATPGIVIGNLASAVISAAGG